MFFSVLKIVKFQLKFSLMLSLMLLYCSNFLNNENTLYVPLPQFFACMHIFQDQLNAMHLSRLHAATLQSGEARPCSRSSHVANSEEGAHTKSSACEQHPHAIPTIPEVHEPLERKARFRSRNVMSLVGVILLFNVLKCK